jgi:hypothetical protein
VSETVSAAVRTHEVHWRSVPEILQALEPYSNSPHESHNCRQFRTPIPGEEHSLSISRKMPSSRDQTRFFKENVAKYG